jgi:hypothetical protein
MYASVNKDKYKTNFVLIYSGRKKLYVIKSLNSTAYMYKFRPVKINAIMKDRVTDESVPTQE